ncbi:hypothetical protein Q5424_08225 [Conexibacter sp. JD483]|uniref:hypothetical protein n=1 Tax=unclassified Conexibacter TaxID=2627773 RepID=UPI002721D613|nr:MULTISPECIES: hypothetical protein [unclassified Conexibacter]MDO8183976.1 hypothetical protein [Conexibacter sp. CPCC 205706]MDO8196968.1 hypothetical protein [Conexibacter sp. CPCC 205762]MDR9369062.1 hypothetical protein [Conexibacter sp. JD483]
MFVSGDSGIPPYAVFRQALDAGDLGRVRTLARLMPSVGIEDALRICLLLRDHDGYERAAVKWLGRFALEARSASVEDVVAAAAALNALPHRPDAAMERLWSICARAGVAS